MRRKSSAYFQIAFLYVSLTMEKKHFELLTKTNQQSKLDCQLGSNTWSTDIRAQSGLHSSEEQNG